MSMFNFNRAEPGNYSLHVFMFFEVSLYICLASSCFRDTPFLQKGRQVSLTFLPCLFVLTSVKTARWRSPSSHFSVERLVFLHPWSFSSASKLQEGLRICIRCMLQAVVFGEGRQGVITREAAPDA